MLSNCIKKPLIGARTDVCSRYLLLLPHLSLRGFWSNFRFAFLAMNDETYILILSSRHCLITYLGCDENGSIVCILLEISESFQQ